jgi:hypothetical protein
LLKNYYQNQMSNHYEVIKNLYLGKDASFRGFRQT